MTLNNSNLNPFASLFEPYNDENNNLDNSNLTPAPAPEAKPNALSNLGNDANIINLETIEARPSEAQAPEAKPSTRVPLPCQLERNRGKPCSYHPLYYINNIRTKGEPCPRAHKMKPLCPTERNGGICQGHFPQLGPNEQQCPFYHKPLTVETAHGVTHVMVHAVAPVQVIESKTPQKCSNEVKFGFCGFHPSLYFSVNPPRGAPCPKLHERVPPCPIQRSGALCTVENCGFFHKKANNNLERQQARPTVAADLFAPRTRHQTVQVPLPIQAINIEPPVARARRHFDVPLPKICLTSTNVVPV